MNKKDILILFICVITIICIGVGESNAYKYNDACMKRLDALEEELYKTKEESKMIDALMQQNDNLQLQISNMTTVTEMFKEALEKIMEK